MGIRKIHAPRSTTLCYKLMLFAIHLCVLQESKQGFSTLVQLLLFDFFSDFNELNKQPLKTSYFKRAWGEPGLFSKPLSHKKKRGWREKWEVRFPFPHETALSQITTLDCCADTAMSSSHG